MEDIKLEKCGVCNSLHTIADLQYSRELVKCVDCGAVIFIGEFRAKTWIDRAAFEVLLNSNCVWSEAKDGRNTKM